ncbi:MAG: helix-turn-helix domain-containing protein [Desulfuromusa sp.]|jgi:sugar-specific transcriptional regulator TrmB|nr:helix-turn-helix domain-containing protein [Desulfuromusa sp.]
MLESYKMTEFGFSQYETSCYMALVAQHPSNGSQLSKLSGIARSRIYDVLNTLSRKGLVFEIEQGSYVPLPPQELKKRLKSEFDSSLKGFEQELEAVTTVTEYEYIMTLKGHDKVMQKAIEIIDNAETELYIRLFPPCGRKLASYIDKAAARGVGIRYVCMGPMPHDFRIQIEHPNAEELIQKIGGESVDIIADKSEALVGMFEQGKEDLSPFIWTRNKWFVVGNRDSLRHDFYHYFLNKTYDCSEPLTDAEKQIYEFIKADE